MIDILKSRNARVTGPVGEEFVSYEIEYLTVWTRALISFNMYTESIDAVRGEGKVFCHSRCRSDKSSGRISAKYLTCLEQVLVNFMYEYAIVVAAGLNDDCLPTLSKRSILDLAMFQAMSAKEICRQDSQDIPLDIGFQILKSIRLHQRRRDFVHNRHPSSTNREQRCYQTLPRFSIVVLQAMPKEKGKS